jgi:hypothetical protein
MPENFGYEVSEAQAVDLVEAILDSPIRFLDYMTAPGGVVDTLVRPSTWLDAG